MKRPRIPRGLAGHSVERRTGILPCLAAALLTTRASAFASLRRFLRLRLSRRPKDTPPFIMMHVTGTVGRLPTFAGILPTIMGQDGFHF